MPSFGAITLRASAAADAGLVFAAWSPPAWFLLLPREPPLPPLPPPLLLESLFSAGVTMAALSPEAASAAVDSPGRSASQ